MSSIAIHNISKAFPRATIIQRATLDIDPGERVALLGRSGCGKSTLLRIAVGLEAADSGHVRLLDKAVTRPPIPASVSYLTQRPVLLPWLSAQSNALLPIALQRKPTQSEIETVRTLFQAFDLAGYERSKPQQLSGGMRQRVSLIQALASEPSALILDEPFSALDDITRRSILVQLLDWLSTKRCCLLMVTHSFEDAAYIADRTVFWRTTADREQEGDLLELSEVPRFIPSRSLADFASVDLSTRKQYLFQKYIDLQPSN